MAIYSLRVQTIGRAQLGGCGGVSVRNSHATACGIGQFACVQASLALWSGAGRALHRDLVALANRAIGRTARYNDLGVKGLKSRLSPGRPPALTEAQMAELHELVIRGPDPAVDEVVRWRCVDLQAEVARRFSVEVHANTIGRWLHELGLTRLQPRPVHPQKDPDARRL